jgi:hypothetical protein
VIPTRALLDVNALRGWVTCPITESATDAVWVLDGDVPTIVGHRQATDAHLLTLGSMP